MIFRHPLLHKSGIIVNSLLNAYGLVFFSNNRFFAILLVLITFLDWPLGVSGLLAVGMANGLAFGLGFETHAIERGNFGFNALLTGLGLALYFSPGPIFLLVLFIGTITSLFLTVSLRGILGKYGLPYLSLPFIFALWMVLLAASDFLNLGLTERNIFHLNTIYSRGGWTVFDVYNWFETFPLPDSLHTFFKSLAAIFFQQNIFAGILIAIGLLSYSRMAFLLSLTGFYAAFVFYQLIGADFNTLNYTYIGFNYILTSIAIGGFYLIPSRSTILWVILIIPLVATLTMSLTKIFAVWHLAVYALPFNISVLLFLYVLKLRTQPNKKPVEVFIQNNSPEKNFYAWQNDAARFGKRTFIPVKLPFFGTWTVTQGHAGEETHKEDWQYAWDFMIVGLNDLTYKNEGNVVEDYYCYNKAIIAPANGTIIEVVDNIHDNAIGDVNTINNWGNTIIIKHSDYLFSKLSHLKPGSIKVKEGDKITTGMPLAACGNSGRSPYPHLHFQLQTTAYIGSPTLLHPIANYIDHSNDQKQLKIYSIPQKEVPVSNIKSEELLTKAFHFVPGERLQWIDKEKTIVEEWSVQTSIYNKSYFYCQATNSKAWFENDGALFYFTHFEGSRSSILYHFYRSAYMVQMEYNQQLRIDDVFPANKLFAWHELVIQDFLAPFILFLKARFHLQYTAIDNTSFPTQMSLKTKVVKEFFGHRWDAGHYELKICSSGIRSFTIKSNAQQQTVSCIIPA
jgi:urea transporter